MPAPKPIPRKGGNASEADLYAAQRYLDLMSEDNTLSPEEVRAIRSSIDAMRRGEMTLAEFEDEVRSVNHSSSPRAAASRSRSVSSL